MRVGFLKITGSGSISFKSASGNAAKVDGNDAATQMSMTTINTRVKLQKKSTI